MSESSLSKYRTYRGLTKALLTAGGLWPYHNSSIFYRVWPYLQIIVSSGMVLAILGFVREHFSNVALVTRGLSVMTSHLTTMFKLMCLAINREDLAELHEHLDPYVENLLKTFKSTDLILKDVNSFRLLSWGLTFFAFIATCALIFMPLLVILHYHQQGIELTNYPLIYPSVYPWKIISNGWVYKANYVFESIATLIMFFVTASVDSLFNLYVFQMVGQLREISYCITHLDSFDKNNSVVQCVVQYEKLMKCMVLLEKIYGFIFLWIMATNAVVLCSLLFQISQMKSISITRGLLFTTYITLKVIQTFMYTWGGSYLTDEVMNTTLSYFFLLEAMDS
ncbi:uncharacterized protein LOC123273550 isoform X2 [Cotesia glomerata]|uniref:uncharacterized protein LOC123273550 isoform X2 n=1 Tax=Cotesia glomerata TaxID=32391 RepID=UPI001D00CD4D|nr:uncharacterized protein LOC123273550 isoform X2 [Cotesia glomerata]